MKVAESHGRTNNRFSRIVEIRFFTVDHRRPSGCGSCSRNGYRSVRVHADSPPDGCRGTRDLPARGPRGNWQLRRLPCRRNGRHLPSSAPSFKGHAANITGRRCLDPLGHAGHRAGRRMVCVAIHRRNRQRAGVHGRGQFNAQAPTSAWSPTSVPRKAGVIRDRHPHHAPFDRGKPEPGKPATPVFSQPTARQRAPKSLGTEIVQRPPVPYPVSCQFPKSSARNVKSRLHG
jgi:hypothetical protein